MIFTAEEATVDDLMRVVLEHLLSAGTVNVATRGSNRELLGAVLHLTNPRARLSRTETRGKLFSCLGELCWYLSGSDRLDQIVYYVRQYASEASGTRVLGAYGPRLFGEGVDNQLLNIIDLLERRPSTRQAVIQLFDRDDLVTSGTSVPCTCTLQFIVREHKLHLIAHMRSNDAYLGLPHDIYCFTMLQEIVAVAIRQELGNYTHFVGSLHLYDTSVGLATQFLSEGWQSTTSPMPPMPSTDLWDEIGRLRVHERLLRTDETASAIGLPQGYWGDLARLLGVFRARKREGQSDLEQIKAEMSSKIYEPYL